jgi:hypothetical protein
MEQLYVLPQVMRYDALPRRDGDEQCRTPDGEFTPYFLIMGFTSLNVTHLACMRAAMT